MGTVRETLWRIQADCKDWNHSLSFTGNFEIMKLCECIQRDNMNRNIWLIFFHSCTLWPLHTHTFLLLHLCTFAWNNVFFPPMQLCTLASFTIKHLHNMHSWTHTQKDHFCPGTWNRIWKCPDNLFGQCH